MTQLIHPVTGEELTASEVWPVANMLVTFDNGDFAVYPNVRFLAIPGFVDPIKIRFGGTVVEFETDTDDIITLLGVRSFMMDHS